ncbi:LolA family protein [Pareuzebyella sediminis]|uniref:LolA family protein n=1 Tax=Pareuzebyella sediminis TaxID=2607998 RepID=UPI001E58564A|nr:outer membrane lipoprotein carrier protein LolA [Pareuzebyella sediminis]
MLKTVPYRPSRTSKEIKIFWISLLFILALTQITAQTKMSPPEATALRKEVKNRAEATTTITSDFSQYKHLDFLENDIESKGKLAFKAPDLVRWEYIEPFDYSVLFKDQTLYINDDGNKSNLDVGSSKIFKQLNQLITASIRGDMFDESKFFIEYFKKGGNSLVYFLPKDNQLSEIIKAFHLTFNDKAEVIGVKMIEPSDDYTKIEFANRKVNESISDAVFNQ